MDEFGEIEKAIAKLTVERHIIFNNKIARNEKWQESTEAQRQIREQGE